MSTAHTHVKRRIFLPFGHDFSVDSEKMKNPKNQPKQCEKRKEMIFQENFLFFFQRKGSIHNDNDDNIRLSNVVSVWSHFLWPSKF